MPGTGETTSGAQSGPRTFRKKDAEIEAMQLLDTRRSALAIAEWAGGHYSPDSNPDGSDVMHFVVLPTVLGKRLVSPGDWIVQDANGRFCPYRASDFAATYEPVMP